MSIAVPDRCILAESDQLIKYSSPSNSQTEALKQKANTLGLSAMQHKLVGHFWWERGEIVMSIAVPDRCILAESDQLIKYSSPSNSQTEALKQKANTLGLSAMQHKLVGHFWWEWPVKQKNEKNVHFAGLAPPTSA